MKRIGTLIALLSLALTVTRAAAAPQIFELDYSFETSLEGFQGGAVDMKHLTSTTLVHAVEPTDTMGTELGLLSPNGYAALTNANGAEAVYMIAKVEGYAQVVRLTFQGRDLSGCGRCAVIAYVGADGPTGLAGFQKVGLLKTGWGSYTLDVPVNTPYLKVAIGIMNLDMTKLTQQAGIDNVQVKFLGD